MPRKRKKQFDDYDDWQDAPTADDVQPEQEVAKVSLEDFVIKEKVSAFCRSYVPCKELDPGYEVFDDVRLREVFKAYVCGLGDPLKLYVEDLKLYGNFQMEMSMATGEPCIFARRR